jgi:hypothetical protein
MGFHQALQFPVKLDQQRTFPLLDLQLWEQFITDKTIQNK